MHLLAQNNQLQIKEVVNWIYQSSDIILRIPGKLCFNICRLERQFGTKVVQRGFRALCIFLSSGTVTTTGSVTMWCCCLWKLTLPKPIYWLVIISKIFTRLDVTFPVSEVESLEVSTRTFFQVSLLLDWWLATVNAHVYFVSVLDQTKVHCIMIAGGQAFFLLAHHSAMAWTTAFLKRRDSVLFHVFRRLLQLSS